MPPIRPITQILKEIGYKKTEEVSPQYSIVVINSAGHIVPLKLSLEEELKLSNFKYPNIKVLEHFKIKQALVAPAYVNYLSKKYGTSAAKTMITILSNYLKSRYE